MKKRIFFLLVLIKAASAQQADNWYFGVHAGLNFSGPQPVPLTNGATNNGSTNIEGCSAISDNNGQVLFYTDGETVYNRNHVVMQNGSGLAGGQSSSQSALILPKPGDPDKYYIFTTDDFIHNFAQGFNYSLVDMCLDNGLGGVMPNFKNIHLLDSASEKLTACRHSNGTDYWVVTQKHLTNQFFAFQLSASGVSFPVISATGPVHGGGTLPSSIGQMKISPDHSWLALVDGQGCFPYAEICQFNNNSGIVQYVDSFLPGGCPGPFIFHFGVAFSPNSRYVYFTRSDTLNHIYQYDLVLQSFIYDLMPSSGIAGLQLGPDGKIYCVTWNASGYLSVINNPDMAGPACNFTYASLYLDGGNVTYSLPGFVDDFDYPPTVPQCALPVAAFQAVDDQICPGTCTGFTNFSLGATSCQWYFPGGNPSSSTAIHPASICYAAPGLYDVTLIAYNVNVSDTLTQTQYINVFPYAPAQSIIQSGDTLFCSVAFPVYQWFFNGDTLAGATGPYYIATQSGDYSVICLDNNGCSVEAVVLNVIAGTGALPSAGEFLVFPVPSSGLVYVVTPDLSIAPDAIEIFSMTGASLPVFLYAESGSTWSRKIILDLSSLAPAIYVASIKSGDRIFRSRVIIQR